MGFRKGRETIDTIYLLKAVIGKNLEKEMKEGWQLESGTEYRLFCGPKGGI